MAGRNNNPQVFESDWDTFTVFEKAKNYRRFYKKTTKRRKYRKHS